MRQTDAGHDYMHAHAHAHAHRRRRIRKRRICTTALAALKKRCAASMVRAGMRVVYVCMCLCKEYVCM